MHKGWGCGRSWESWEGPSGGHPPPPEGDVLSRDCFMVGVPRSYEFEVGADLVQLCLLFWNRRACVELRHAPPPSEGTPERLVWQVANCTGDISPSCWVVSH